MSQQDFQRFQKEINEDEALLTALTERFGDLSDVPADELTGFAAEHGYEFSVDEAQDELSDAQLEAVAGGAGYLKLGGIEGEADKASPMLMLGYSAESASFNFSKVRI